MPGSHAHRQSTSHHRALIRRRRWPLAIAALTAVGLFVSMLSGIAALRAGTARAADPCPGPTRTLAVSPELAGAVGDLLRGAGCTSVEVEPLAPESVAAAVSRGAGPDYWIPDSSVWATGSRLVTLEPSLALSPVVVAAAEGEAPATWSSVLGDEAFVAGDPTGEAATALALTLAADGVPEAEAAAMMAPLAQRSLDRGATTVDKRLATVAGSGGLTVASEQVVRREQPDLDVSVPRRGTAFLDFPLLGRVGDTSTTADFLAERLASTGARARYIELGFRTSTASAVTAPVGGVGAVREADLEPDQVQAARSQWALFSAPSRSLAVLDISGSMLFETAGGTRLDLALAAARDGLRLFPGAAEVGLWAFSEALVGDQDHEVVVPLAPLEAPVEGGTQRDALDVGLTSLAGRSGGGTGLYDTVLAAYESLRGDYREGAFHSLVVFTDGTNDDPGSIGRRALLDRLRAWSRETPIRIVAIGISPDADEESLAAIARATQGVSYVATRPEDVRNVFVTALGGSG